MSDIIHYTSANLIMRLAGNRSCKGLKLSKQIPIYKKMKAEQWNPLSLNIKRQKEKLYNIICFAIENVPYYRKMGFHKTDFHIDTIFDDIKKIPILTKDIIRKENVNMYPDVKLNDWSFDNISGGTTGEPVPFRHSGVFFDNDQASKLLFDDWAGRKIGDSQIRLWGSERDIISGKKDWINKIYRWSRNEIFLNSFVMSDEDMDNYIDIINKRKPKMILAYVQSARELAQYIFRKNKKIYSPNAIMVSAGTLDEYTYELLRNVFDCSILNRYGSREMGDMACSCKRNEGLHLNIFTSYIEILDDNYKPCEEEKIGNIITTSLLDYSMPIIRYEIGDTGAWTSHQCSCGRGMPLLKSVNGRRIDIFKSITGEKVYGDYFTHLLYDETAIKQFQVIQEAVDLIRIKLVLYSEYSKADLQDLYNRINKNIFKAMGKIQVVYEIVEDIPVSKSGKRAYTINAMRN